MSSRSSLITAACYVLLVSVSAVGASQCNPIQNSNSSALDIANPIFTVSEAECCNLCSNNTRCAAAVFNAYYCHLKGSVGSLSAQSGSTVLVLSQTTEAPTTATQVPTTTTTMAPTVAPTTTTPAPTPRGTVTIVREVLCRYSSHCNQSNDNSCYQWVYYNDTCHKETKRVCGEYKIAVETYSEDGCGGVITATTHEKVNKCEYIGYEFHGHYCDVQEAPLSGLEVLRTTCPYGCNSGGECSSFKLTTGVCLRSNPFQNLKGQSIMGWCFPDYVVFSSYGSIDCTGPIDDSSAEPLGCWPQGYSTVQNVCG